MEPILSKSTVVGLLILLVLIIGGVYSFGPPQKTSEQQLGTLMDHVAGRNFIEAEIMAQRLYPNPTAIWYDQLCDQRVLCGLVGQGVWYAKGWMNKQSSESPGPTSWEVYFLPGSAEPLYAKVGRNWRGDLKAALELAGHPDAGKGAAADGK